MEFSPQILVPYVIMLGELASKMENELQKWVKPIRNKTGKLKLVRVLEKQQNWAVSWEKIIRLI